MYNPYNIYIYIMRYLITIILLKFINICICNIIKGNELGHRRNLNSDFISSNADIDNLFLSQKISKIA